MFGPRCAVNFLGVSIECISRSINHLAEVRIQRLIYGTFRALLSESNLLAYGINQYPSQLQRCPFLAALIEYYALIRKFARVHTTSARSVSDGGKQKYVPEADEVSSMSDKNETDIRSMWWSPRRHRSCTPLAGISMQFASSYMRARSLSVLIPSDFQEACPSATSL